MSRSLVTIQHPARGPHPAFAAPFLAPDARLDWSMNCVGKWIRHRAKGKVPHPIFKFAAGHHKGKIYVFGGQRGGDFFDFSDDMHCLDLSSMTWRKVKAKGPVPHLQDDTQSTAVWNSKLCLIDRCDFLSDHPSPRTLTLILQ